MKIAIAVVTLCVITLSAFPVVAQKLDPASAEALAAVMRMLSDPSQRGAAVAAEPRAAAADRQIRALAGSDKTMEEFYGLAAQVFDEITRASGGDTAKMNELLTRAQSDPAAFAALLSPGTLAKLQELATKMSDLRR